MKKILIIPDLHVPFHNKKVVSIAKQIAKDKKPDYIVYIGDCIDAHAISKYTQQNLKSGIFSVEKECEQFAKIHKEIKKSTRNKDVISLGCLGNHDGHRVVEAVDKMEEKGYPDFAKLIKEKTDIRNFTPDIKWVDYNKCHKIGNLWFTHGEYHSKHHAMAHASAYKANIVYGHTHTYQAHVCKGKADNKRHTAVSIGCACKKNLKYLKNGASPWVNMLAFAYIYGNKHNLYPIQINNGICVFEGKKYKG